MEYGFGDLSEQLAGGNLPMHEHCSFICDDKCFITLSFGG